MFGPTKVQRFQSLARHYVRIMLAVCFAGGLMPLRNALHAEDLTAESVNSVAKMDSLFHTHYDPLVSPGKGTGWKPYNRMRWFYGQRAFPSGDIPAAARMQAWETKQSSHNRRALDESWTACGPSNLAGRVLCLAWDPSNTNIIYVGSASGGLWKTTSGGSNWFPLTDNLPSLAVGAVALDPTNSNTLFIGTGEGSFNVDAVYGAGILKSTDGGGSWNTTGMSWTASQSRAVNKIVIDPTNPLTMWCATNIAGGGGVFKSTDCGGSWTLTLSGDAKDLILHPDSAQVLYAALGYPWGSSANGVYKSTDGGVTWALRSSGLPAGSSMGRMQICLARSNPQTLYAGISTTISANAVLLGVYRTTNGGGSWTLQSSTPNMYNLQGWYNLVCEVNPTNPSIVYSSGLDCYRSNNSGIAWTQKTFWGYTPGHSQYAHSDHHALAFKPGDPNTIIVGTDGGLFKSTNAGDTWTDLNNGLAVYQFYAMSNDALNSSVAFGGTQDNGTNKYTGSTSWSNVYGGDGGYCAVDFTNSNIVYAETQYGNHYKSTDGGSNWSPIQSGISGNGAWVTPMVMDPTNHNTLYTSTNVVYRSTNAGSSWTAVSGNLNGQYISTISVAPSSPSVIYVGTEYNGQVWRTTDGGTNWASVSSGLPYRYITRVAVHPTDASTAFATVSGYGTGHVWKTTNGGTAWSNASGGLPDIPCNAVVIDQSNANNVYVGTDIGVYASTDGGANWSDYSAGLPNVVVDDLALHPTSGVLRASTHGRGMWQTPTSTPSVTVMTPNGGELWITNSTQAITWATGGLGGTVTIDLNRNYPAGGWENLNAAAPNSGSYSWTPTGPTTNHARVRITSNVNPSATDQSNGDFSIGQPQLTVIAPNGSEVWAAGTLQTISWTLSGASGNVVVQIKRGFPAGSWTTLATSAGSSSAWTVTAPANSACRVRAYLQADSTVADTSNANFSIVEPAVTVTALNGGEILTPGSLQTLRWSAQNYTGTYKVELNRSYPGGSWTTLAATVTSDSLVWTIDQTPSSAARIRVTANLYPSAWDVSDGNFTVLTPTLTISTPNGGEGWAAGTTQTVRWSHNNLSGPLNVYVNRDYPSGTWIPIALSTNADTFAWSVLTPYTTTARIRVASVNLPGFYDESNGNFTIGNAIVLSAPSGGESWAAGSLQTISWARFNANGAATVELNRSFPSSSWEVLQSNVSVNSMNWTVTGPATTTARVRVRLNSDPSIGDTSSSNFTIPAPALAVTAPNGGDVWSIGGLQTIWWSRNGATGNVTVELCRNYPGGPWEQLTTTAGGSNTTWTVTAPAASNARVRVYLTAAPTIGDTSDANFAIGFPVLALQIPNGGEIWQAGAGQTIRWNRTYAPGGVRIRLNRSFPDGVWETLATGVTDDAYWWTVTSPATSAARICVDLESIGTVADTSVASFSIVIPQITIASPNGGETWVTGVPQTIPFSRVNASGPVTLQLNRTYPSAAWETLTATDTTSSIAWTPAGSVSNTCRVRVFLNAIPSVGDTSDGNFAIASSALTITAPNGGEQWAIGLPATISWNRWFADGNVTVALNRNYPGGSWETLSSGVSGNSLPLTIAGPTTSNARIRIWLNSTPTTFDESDANFAIVQPALALVAPDGGESFTIGGPLTIRWTRTAATGAISVFLNRNYPGGAWETLTSTASSDSFAWTASGLASTSCRVKIRLNSDTTLTDLSTANFSLVQRTLTLTSHNDGGTYYTGSSSTVSLSRTNAPGNVVLELCRNFPGGAWELVTNALSGNSYAWTVNAPSTSNARLRIKLASEPYVSDTCDVNFVIAAPSVVLSTPNGGEQWAMGSPQNIAWQRFGVSDAVRIEVNRSYPAGIWETIAPSVAGSSFAWTVSGPVSSATRVRVVSTVNGAIGDTSNANFAIMNPPLVLATPNGGDTADIGFPFTIRWLRTLTPGDVRVELSRNGAVGPWEFLGNTSGDSLTWNVSGAAGNTARVRILLTANPNVGDTSAANFTIFMPALTLTSPIGGKSWQIGSPHPITWTRNRFYGTVRLEWKANYPSDNWVTLASGLTGNSWNWSVPLTASDHARVRVIGDVQSQFADTSGDFSILDPHLTVRSPNGNDTLIVGQPYVIHWSRTGAAEPVKIELNRTYPTGAWEILANSVTADSFSWNVTGTDAVGARIRASLTANSAVNDISDGNFRIMRPSLVLLSPVAGDSIGIGLPVTFRWAAVGMSPEAHLYVKRNWPSGSWEPLVSNVNATSWMWTASGPATEMARFRILSAQNPTIGDTTDGAVRIGQPSLNFTSPSSTITFVQGDTATISWMQRYCSGDMRVEISRQGASGPWSELAVVAGNSLRWPVTSPGSAQVRFRISLVVQSSLSSVTGFDCSIMIPTLTVTLPVTGAAQALGRDMVIVWARSFMTAPVDVMLQRTISGPLDTLRTLVGADSIHWRASGASAVAARIIVRGRSAPVTEGQSRSFSLLAPQLVLRAPLGGEMLVADSITGIRWSRVAVTDPVRIELKHSTGDAWNVLAASVTDTFYSWQVTGPTSHDAQMRIISTLDPSLGDTSGLFEILTPALSFHALPTTHMIAGVGVDLSWTRTALGGTVEVRLSRDGGLTWPEQIATNLTSDGCHWTPTAPAAVSAHLMVRSLLNPQISAISEVFDISVPALTILSPEAGHELLIGDSLIMAWQRNAFTAPVRVLLRRALGPTDTLAEGVLSSSLTVTAHLPEANTSWIVVEDASTGIPRDSVAVDGPYLPRLTLDVFRSGEPWLLNRSTTLRWSRQRTTGNVVVKINRHFPSGTWEILGSTTPDSLTTTITGTPSDSLALGIISAQRPLAADTIFNIHLVRPSLALHPLGQSEYRIGSGILIAWSQHFVNDAIRLELDRHYPSGTWETLHSGADSSFSWMAVGDTTRHARLRIVSLEDSTLADTLVSDFTLYVPHLRFAGALNSDYYSGDTLHVAWIADHTEPPFTLVLWRDAIAETLAVTNTLSYHWIVAPPHADAARFVVSDVSGAVDTSAAFAIHAPSLAFITPTTSGTDTAGSTLDLAWHWTDGSGSVRLDVSWNALSGPWTALADSTADSLFIYNVPHQETDSLLFRATSLRWPALQAVSAMRHVVVPALHMQMPGGNTWYIGEQKWIRWSRAHLNGTVRVEMTAQERSQPWQELGVAQSDSFLWTVTGPEADLVALRVSSVARPEVSDTTASPLRIRRPRLTVLEPNGGDTLRVGDQIRLRWTAEGISGNVGILLWRGDPVNRLDTIFADTPNDSSEIWTITAPQAHQCLLLIASVANPTVFDTSDARFEITGADVAQDAPNGLPRDYSFAVPYPNPFNATTQLEFALPRNGIVRLTIYDVLGREVENLVNEPRRAGLHRVTWNAARVASGAYFARLSSGSFVATHRLLLIK